MRKPDFLICGIKCEDQLSSNQLHSNKTANKHLCFSYMDSITPLLPEQRKQSSLKQSPLAVHVPLFMSDIAEIPKTGFLPTWNNTEKVTIFILVLCSLNDLFCILKSFDVNKFFGKSRKHIRLYMFTFKKKRLLLKN